MKKILLAAAGVAALAGYATAANLSIYGQMGQSLATISNTDNDDDDDDGLSFFDHYLDANQAYSPFPSVSLSGENGNGGAELQFKWADKNLKQLYLNAWINVASPFGAPGVLTFKYGRFDAYPLVDFVTDANRGYHYQSYAVNPLINKTAGFEPAVMQWFIQQQGGFVHSKHDRVGASYDGYWSGQSGTSLTATSWFFHDANNAGAAITYYDIFTAVHPGFMVQYTPFDDLVIRFNTLTGSANDKAGAISHDFYGEKTFTNWNAQVSYKVGDIAKLGLTVKMSDMLSGAYTSGSGLWESAGTDLNVALAASSDQLVDGLRLFFGYAFAGVYLGMEGDIGNDTYSETYLFHAIDLRAVYDIDEQLSVGLNTNVSIVNQSEYAVNYVDEDTKKKPYEDDIVGFNVGLSASYALSDILAIDFNTGFRCLNVNNKVGTERGKSDAEKGDLLAVSSIGFEPSLVFTFSKTASLTLGVNVLIQNLSGDDVHLQMPRTNHLTAYGDYYPFTTTVTLPLFLAFRI